MTTHLSSPLKSPRVYFRAYDNGPEYYVDMQQGAGDEWWAVIPAVDPATRAISYRVAAQDANNNWISGTPVMINAASTCPTMAMSSQDKVAADNIVLGLTSLNEPSAPVGFTCQGIKTVITADGQMRPAEDCRMAIAKLGAPPAPAPAAGPTTVVAASHGLSPATIAALAIGGGLAGLAIYNNNHKNNNSVSPSRP